MSYDIQSWESTGRKTLRKEAKRNVLSSQQSVQTQREMENSKLL